MILQLLWTIMQSALSESLLLDLVLTHPGVLNGRNGFCLQNLSQYPRISKKVMASVSARVLWRSRTSRMDRWMDGWMDWIQGIGWSDCWNWQVWSLQGRLTGWKLSDKELMLSPWGRFSFSSWKPQFCSKGLSSDWIRPTHIIKDNLYLKVNWL